MPDDVATRRIIVTGDRDWSCNAITESVVCRLKSDERPFVVVHGDATGVDRAFADACCKHEVPHEPHPADWGKHGRGAGPRRNAEMVALGAEFCLAVHRDIRGSRGTKDCVRRCLAAGIPAWLIEDEFHGATWRYHVERVTLKDLE